MGSRKRPRWWTGTGFGRRVCTASSIPNPERKIGTIEMLEGAIVVVVYSYPKGVLATGPLFVDKPAARASHPTMVVISWTSAFVSRAFAEHARSWESFPSRHGWDETCTLGGV